MRARLVLPLTAQVRVLAVLVGCCLAEGYLVGTNNALTRLDNLPVTSFRLGLAPPVTIYPWFPGLTRVPGSCLVPCFLSFSRRHRRRPACVAGFR